MKPNRLLCSLLMKSTSGSTSSHGPWLMQGEWLWSHLLGVRLSFWLESSVVSISISLPFLVSFLCGYVVPLLFVFLFCFVKSVFMTPWNTTGAWSRTSSIGEIGFIKVSRTRTQILLCNFVTLMNNPHTILHPLFMIGKADLCYRIPRDLSNTICQTILFFVA